MNTNRHESGGLEAWADRALKGLPELQAPPTLARRVMTEIERRERAPWYRHSWQLWPIPVRAAAFMALACMFGAICYGAWQLPHVNAVVAFQKEVGGLFSAFGTVGHGLAVAARVAAESVKNLGSGFVIGCVAAVALGYAICLGLGTVGVRMALARRSN